MLEIFKYREEEDSVEEVKPFEKKDIIDFMYDGMKFKDALKIKTARKNTLIGLLKMAVVMPVLYAMLVMACLIL